jgi:thioredoxin reductase
LTHDVIVIGGSYAGMAAALQLVRARRKVLVIDAGVRRNRFAATSHGFLGQDGADPARIAAEARAQLMRYRDLAWIEARAEAVAGQKDSFAVSTSDGALHLGRRLAFAIGVSDALPAIAGLEERWGRSVFHCPYCHGYELDRGPIGVIATGPMSVHQAMLVSEWGTVTFFAADGAAPDDDARAGFAARGIAIETVPIARIEGHADVRLTDGRMRSFAGLFTASRNAPASSIAATLGCALEETPLGCQIRTDPAKETTIAGAFACGDVARAPHSVSLAVADGAWAGMQVHRSLVF